MRDPLMPLVMFRLRNVATSNIVGMLWAAAMFAWFFISALHMQLVLDYSPLQVGHAMLASVAAAQTKASLSSGTDADAALNAGYHMAFFIGALFAASAALLGAIFIRVRIPVSADETQAANDANIKSGEMQSVARVR